MSQALSQIGAVLLKVLDFGIGKVRDDLEGEEQDKEIRRIVLTIITLFNIPFILFYIYAEAGLGFELRQNLRWLGLVVSTVGFVLARSGYFHANLTRIVFGYFLLMIFFMFYADQDLTALIFMVLVPPATYLLFGEKEGLIWCLAVFLITAPVVPSGELRYIFMTYLCMTLLSMLLERLRVRAETLSEERRLEREAEHQLTLAAQAELEESEERFRTYSELASDWLFELDENLTYTFATPRLTEILGGDVTGQKLGELKLRMDSDSDTLGPLFREEELINHQVRFLNFNGERVVALLSAKPLRDENGVFKGYIGAGKDITQIKGAEEELRLKDQALHHMQKLEALGQLTSGVAHDFNNLLTIISGNLDLLQHDKSDEKEVEMINASLRAVDRAGELTQQLLSFSRKQELDPKPVHISEVFDRLNQMFSRTMEGTMRIETSVEKDIWSCMADEGQLENAVLNLSLNGRDAMNRRGKLVLGASNYHHTDENSQLEPGDYVRIWVEDNGCGIHENELDRIMEPFYTTKPVGEGTGLGLSMVYGFARQSGGVLEVESEVSKGSKFSILLPRSYINPAHRDQEGSGAEALSGKVIVIDDDVDVLNVVRMGLEKMGLEVVSFDNAESALEQFDDIAPQLVVSDMMLGEGMNGAEFADVINKQHPELPVLLISGNPDQLLSDSEYRRHSVNLLRKPFTYKKLREAVQDRL